MTEIKHDKPYIKYAEDVIDGKIVACRAIILACRRFISWFSRDDMYFDYGDVDKHIRVVSKLKHSKGKTAHKPFILLDYQQWIFANIFGWRYKDTQRRVTKNALLFLARKSGKTALAAAIGISQLILEGNGQEIDFLANSGAQARIGYEMCRDYVESIDPKGILFKRYRDSIRMDAKKSFIAVRNSDSMTLDGLGSSTFVLDEMHAAQNWDLYNVMKSSQGFQTEPLAIVITTAGFLLDGYPLFEYRKTCMSILEGNIEDDSTFAALYELDENDDYTDPNVWIKSNPSIGATVTYEYLKDQVQQATNQPSLEYGVKTKNFNIFCQSTDTWIETEQIKALMQPIDLHDYRKEYSFVGVDLAAVSDLACFSVMFPPNKSRKQHPDKFVFKNFIYIPESCFEDSVNKTLYKVWKQKGMLRSTSGNVTDYDKILADMLEFAPPEYVTSLAYDSWNATQFSISATNAGYAMYPFSQSLGNFNKPTKYFEILCKTGKVVIDTNLCVLWQFNNVVLKFDMHENCKVDKPTKSAKIDSIIAMTEALGAYLDVNGDVDLNIV